MNGKEIKDSIFFGIKDSGPYKGRTWMAEDDTYDLHDADYWGLFTTAKTWEEKTDQQEQ